MYEIATPALALGYRQNLGRQRVGLQGLSRWLQRELPASTAPGGFRPTMETCVAALPLHGRMPPNGLQGLVVGRSALHPVTLHGRLRQPQLPSDLSSGHTFRFEIRDSRKH